MTGIISSYESVYAPRVWLEADDEFAQDILDHMQSFEFSDDEKQPNEVVLTINNPGFRFTDDPRFLEGVRFRVRWGYPGDFSPLYAVGITAASPNFPSPTSIPTLTLKAWDLRADMNRQASPTNYGAVSSSEVARKVAKKYNLETNIEESKDARKEMRLQPAGTTDIQYLMSLAAKLNWDCFIDGKVLHFRPKNLDEAPSLTFIYYDNPLGTIFDFKPEVKLKKPGKKGKAGSNTKTGKSATGVGGSNTDTGLGRWRINTDQAKYTEMVRGVKNPGGSAIADPSAEKNKNVNALHAAASKQKIDMKAIEASLKIIGTPRIKARSIVRIEGVGKTYSGNWRVASTRHKIDAHTYTVEVKLTRNGLDKGKNKSNKANTKTDGSGGGDSAGVKGRYYQVQTNSATYGERVYR